MGTREAQITSKLKTGSGPKPALDVLMFWESYKKAQRPGVVHYTRPPLATTRRGAWGAGPGAS